MTFIDFIEKKGDILISVIFVVDFSFASCLWIISSPNVGNFDKLLYSIYMVIFGFLSSYLPVLFKLHRLLRKESGKLPYSKAILKKQINFQRLFIFFYTILVFVLARFMDFIEFNRQSYFVLKFIYVISLNLCFGFFFYVIEIKYKKIAIIIALGTLNLIALLGLFY